MVLLINKNVPQNKLHVIRSIRHFYFCNLSAVYPNTYPPNTSPIPNVIVIEANKEFLVYSFSFNILFSAKFVNETNIDPISIPLTNICGINLINVRVNRHLSTPHISYI